MTAQFAVEAGNDRVFRFSGEVLAASDSRRFGAQRWVSFTLYRTSGGSYVLSRVGHSLLFHDPTCEVVGRNRLEIGAPPSGAVGCELCEPDPVGPVCPERDRRWAVVLTSAQGVVEAVHRRDESSRYLTNVAARLLTQAAIRDRALAEAWQAAEVVR
jgi:hypothetical protein